MEKAPAEVLAALRRLLARERTAAQVSGSE